MGTGRGKQQETVLLNRDKASIDKAAEVNPLQSARQADLLNFRGQVNNGTDIKDIDLMRPNMNLFNNAQRDGADETGVGLLGSNALSGANGKLATLIGEQQKSRRQEQAQGDLYNAFNQTQHEAAGEGQQIAQADTAQRLGVAGLNNQLYTQYLNRPNRPSWWQPLLQGGMMAAGAAGY
jgi:hypothetical protein